jgi:hypothetical protein
MAMVVLEDGILQHLGNPGQLNVGVSPFRRFSALGVFPLDSLRVSHTSGNEWGNEIRNERIPMTSAKTVQDGQRKTQLIRLHSRGAGRKTAGRNPKGHFRNTLPFCHLRRTRNVAQKGPTAPRSLPGDELQLFRR